MSDVNTLTLNNAALPRPRPRRLPEPARGDRAAVEAALASGYRLIDTAAAYGNEREVGEGIRRTGIDRARDLRQTKLWISDYGYDRHWSGFDVSLRKLGDGLDRPVPAPPAGADRLRATVGAYKALERLLADGRVRAIGVSQLQRKHLDEPDRRAQMSSRR